MQIYIYAGKMIKLKLRYYNENNNNINYTLVEHQLILQPHVFVDIQTYPIE